MDAVSPELIREFNSAYDEETELLREISRAVLEGRTHEDLVAKMFTVSDKVDALRDQIAALSRYTEEDEPSE